MPTMLDGPRRPPASGGKARSLVIFLHGYGSDGHDLIELAPPLSRALPNAAFAGAQRTGGAVRGNGWFGVSVVWAIEAARAFARMAPIRPPCR